MKINPLKKETNKITYYNLEIKYWILFATINFLIILVKHYIYNAQLIATLSSSLIFSFTYYILFFEIQENTSLIKLIIFNLKWILKKKDFKIKKGKYNNEDF